jgi:hypothetical protein
MSYVFLQNNQPDLPVFLYRQRNFRQVQCSPRIYTDEFPGYKWTKKEFKSHDTVKHSSFEYARTEPDGRIATTNAIEGFWSMLRRGLDGIYHSVSEKHLDRYLAEFEFRHNHRELSDGERTTKAIRSANGKRLLYKEQTEGVN